MHHDDKQLSEITDRTMRRLMNEAIVLPSKYRETFMEEEQKSLEASREAGNGDATHREIDLLRTHLFSDDVTPAKNRLWLYKQKLNARQGFNDEGYLVSLRIQDYTTIVDEYDTVIGNRVLMLVCSYVIEFLKMQRVNFEIARYAEGDFLLFMHHIDESEVDALLVNMQNGAANHTFKHRSRIFGLTFDAVAIRYLENEPFATVMEQLEEKRFEKKVEEGGTAGRT
ncbi:hypothetical protein LOH54_05395 [Sulfurimonas sp. HSL-3221]|uniref:hypothetical protein n=1 Tax=Sulfurimonadaceae TaxID=2771471 RepID=UPI001E2D7AF6|nr:hypothetical protein [Sulfurimonas sp. HSL-3221]UFS63566.1 hypothetical protein LOH54_05395 [Sulfurimonas sp. HSL-3221]